MPVMLLLMLVLAEGHTTKAGTEPGAGAVHSQSHRPTVNQTQLFRQLLLVSLASWSVQCLDDDRELLIAAGAQRISHRERQTTHRRGRETGDERLDTGEGRRDTEDVGREKRET